MFDVHTLVLFICNIANELLHELVISPVQLGQHRQMSCPWYECIEQYIHDSIARLRLLRKYFAFLHQFEHHQKYVHKNVLNGFHLFSFDLVVSNTSAVSSIDSSVRSGKASTVSFCTITRMTSNYVSGSNLQVQTVQKIQ